VVDNVSDPADVADLLPRAGNGQVVLTARPDVGWTGIGAQLLPLEVLDPDSAAGFLQQRSGDPDPDAALALAETLGWLPLALEQAAGYVAQTGSLSLARYLQLFRTRSAELLGRGRPANRQDTVNTTWSLSLEKLSATTPAAVDLLNLAAFLAPDDLPVDLLDAHAQVLPEPLATVAADSLRLADTVAVLRWRGLAKSSGSALAVHRLLQVVIINGLDQSEQARWCGAAVRLLATVHPADVMTDVASWPLCQRLLPHVLGVADHAPPLDVEPRALGGLLNRTATYLQVQGEYLRAVPLFEQALQISEAALGPDHPTVGIHRNNLGLVLRDLGDLAGARTQLEQALRISEAALGPDHPTVGIHRNNLGGVLRDLGDLAGARTQLERALRISEAALGLDHPDVGICRGNLGGVLRDLGDLAGARTQYERALETFERVYGPEDERVVEQRRKLTELVQGSAIMVAKENGV